MADKQNRKGTVDTTGDVVGATTGGVAGAAAGAAIGALGGPIGAVIGALAGGAGGWWSGRAVSEAMSTYTGEDDDFYRSHYGTSGATGRSRASYDDARPAYQLGHLAGMNPDYQGRSFDDVEPELRDAYASAGQKNWTGVRGYARDAYARGRDVGEQRLTLANEELRVGKRQVQAGEVSLRKKVETEHVQKQVPLLHEEVTIERRPIMDPNASIEVEIHEDWIRIPLVAEEAVVEKSVVGTEEVVLRKQQVTETETVEADLRKERLDVDRTHDHLAATSDMAGADTEESVRATGRGAKRGAKSLGDSMSDAVDDVKDRPSR